MDKAKVVHLIEAIKKREGFECQRCSRCCRHYKHDIQILKEDYEELLEFGYDVSNIEIGNCSEEGRMFYEYNEGNFYNLYWGAVIRFKGGACPYLDKETGLCPLHPHEPLICQIYPCTLAKVQPFSEGWSVDVRDMRMKTYEILMKPCLKERVDNGFKEWDFKFVGYYVEDYEDNE
ncbi:MAG: YkgJ family cysteine cluster protein [Promethearchaeota archaeon]|nr:MAG: YkgJ family cysteine cluster protein [Candidatus Lokiarchaeota archaeon]